MDPLRIEMMFGREGLPLGILVAQSRFSGIDYFWSPAFWSGGQGFKACRKRLLMWSFILTAGVIAVFAGPSIALLMTATRYTNWAAGSASFWLAGDEASLWPITLDVSAIGGTECLNPTLDTLNKQVLNMSGCIWAGYASISQYLKEKHFDLGDTALVIDDGIVPRDVILQSTRVSLETWAHASNVPVGLAARVIYSGWYSAIFNTPSAQPGKIYASISDREETGTTGYISSHLR